MIDGDAGQRRPTVVQAAAGALTATFGACGPPDLPADTAAKRAADRLVPRTGWPACVYFLAVVGMWASYSYVPERPALAVAALASLAGGAWCSVNFWRCRHAHCVVTGAGWLALAGLSGAEALLGHSLINGFEGIAFLAILAAGVVFETGWYRMRGIHAVAPRGRTTEVGPPPR